MKVLLTRGFFAEIDADDWPIVENYRWRVLVTDGRYYAIASWQEGGKQKSVLMHRLILGLKDSRILCDHDDGDGLNNRRLNLRPCTHAQNMRNRRLQSNNTSGFHGVTKRDTKAGIRWVGQVAGSQKQFLTPEEASQWAIEKRKAMWGEFAPRGDRT